MASSVSFITQLASALWTMKNMYDQHNDNKQEMKELEELIDQYGKEVPGLQQTLSTCKGTHVAATVLSQVETDIAEATKKLHDWSTERKFFRWFTSAQRMEVLKKLHRNVMTSVQNNLQMATLSIVVSNLRDNQAESSSSDVKLLDSTAEVKSVLTTQIESMDYNVAEEARDVALKASHSSYADEKLWADVIAAIDSREAFISKHQSLMDPILQTLMIDPVVASNGRTYCRWTIIDNNMKKDPHNPSEEMLIRADNVSLRSELFEAFPEQVSKFRERRSEYRCKALQLVEEDKVADAVVHLQHVLEWDEKDEECVVALSRVSTVLESFGDQSLRASGSDVEDSTSEDIFEATSVEMLSEIPVAGNLSSKLFQSNEELKLNRNGNLSLQLQLRRRWFRGHSKEINHVQWSPNGEEIATASEDWTVVLWDTTQLSPKKMPPKQFLHWSWQRGVFPNFCSLVWWGRAKVTLKGHSSSVNCVAYKVDGRQIVTASSDKTVRVWDAQTGKTIYTLKGHADVVTYVTWSQLGLIASTSADESTKVWNGKSGKELFTLRGHRSEVTCAAWSPAGDRLATTSLDPTAIVWRIEERKNRYMRLHTLIGHKAKVTCVAWNADGKLLVTASFDKSVIVWDSTSGYGRRHEGIHSGWINSVAWCPVTNLIATGSHDCTAGVIDTTRNTIIGEIAASFGSGFGRTSWCTSLCTRWAPSWCRRWCTSWSTDLSTDLSTWSIGCSTTWSTSAVIGSDMNDHKPVRCVSWCPKGDYFVIASAIKMYKAGVSLFGFY